MPTATFFGGSVTALVLETDPQPPFLGGSSGNGDHPVGTTFANLERPREPPPFVAANCYVKTNELRVQEFFRCLCTGEDLAIDWHIVYTDDESLSMFSLKARYIGDSFPEMNSMTFCVLSRALAPSKMSLHPIMPDEFNGALKDKKNVLCFWLLHLFLRREASSLEWPLAKQLCLTVKEFFVPLMKNKKWKFLLDVSTIVTDVAFSLKRPNKDIAFYLFYVGEALEALGRFEEAALIYQDCVDSYPYEGDANDRARRQGDCALAWKRAEEYEMSEEAYVKALHLASLSKPKNLDDENIFHALCNFMNLYHEWGNKDLGRSKDAREIRRLQSILHPLLFVAEFNPRHADALLTRVITMGKLQIPFLKQKLKVKKAAKQAIISSFDASSVSDFRSRILSYKNPRVEAETILNEDGAYAGRPAKEEKAIARHAAKTQFVRRSCDGPGCYNQEQDVPFRKCPCKQVYYCGTSCQENDWRDHRRNCQYHLEKKAIQQHKKNH